MIVAVDTFYFESSSRTAMVCFNQWTDRAPSEESVSCRFEEPNAYVPGQFFKRELPCILDAIRSLNQRVNTIVIDGYVWLDNDESPGLGAYLYEELEQAVKVVGVAKNRLVRGGGIELYRGRSNRPLVVTAAGESDVTAARHIR